jgi:hypothetical protein
MGIALDKGADPILDVHLNGTTHRTHTANAIYFLRCHESLLPSREALNVSLSLGTGLLIHYKTFLLPEIGQKECAVKRNSFFSLP